MSETDRKRNEAARRTLAEKIDWLIEHKWPPGVRPRASSAGVSRAMAEAPGEFLERSTVWKLQTGRNKNPTLKTLKALAAFFGLPTIGYFDDTEDAELINDLTALLTLLESEGVDRDTLRSLAELSPEGRAVVIDMIGCVARRESRS